MKKNRVNFTLAFLLGVASIGLPNTLCASDFSSSGERRAVSGPVRIYDPVMGFDSKAAKSYLDLADRFHQPVGDTNDIYTELKSIIAAEVRQFIQHPTGLRVPAGGFDIKEALSLLELADRFHQPVGDTNDIYTELKSIVAAEVRQFIQHPTGLRVPGGGFDIKEALSLLDLADRFHQPVGDTNDIYTELKSIVAAEVRQFIQHPTGLRVPGGGFDIKEALSLLGLADRFHQPVGDTNDIYTELRSIVAAAL